MTAVVIIIFQVLWSLIVGFFKLLPHGFKYGWLFLLAGIIGAVAAINARDSGAITDVVMGLLCVLSVGGGIALMCLKLWWNSQQAKEPTPFEDEVSQEYRAESSDDDLDEYR